jgi:nicotinate-nucleotide adenylyltransferase
LKLAIFGGTFDPIHKAHLEIALQAARQLGLDRMLFVPAFHPPHKLGVTHAPFQDRVHMVELAVRGLPGCEVSRIEEGTAQSYSIDTIEKVRAGMSPADELFFLIGADAFAEIRTWRRWRDVARAVRFLVVSRPGRRYEAPREARIVRVDTPEMPVSSSQIRAALAAGERPAEMPAPVLEYILKQGLYNTGEIPPASVAPG